MSIHGAINTETSIYTIPSRACKNTLYKCPDCNQRVIFRNGSVRVPHFAHFVSSIKCKFYNQTPGESETHKHAKLFIQQLLNEKKPITFIWSCKNQTKFGECGVSDDSTEERIEYKDGDKVVLEYREPNGKYIADIAVINNEKVRYIIEIKHSHQTTTNYRPEPWFEIYADDVINNKESDYWFDNCRINNKRFCTNCRVKQEDWVSKIPVLNQRYGSERQWKQSLPCICCGIEQYSPEWIQNRPRQVCKICLGSEPENVKIAIQKCNTGIRSIFADTIEN